MKKQLHIYKHLGYFNEVGDIRELSMQSADKIVDYYKKGYGAFYEDDNPDTDLIEEEEIESGAVERGDTRFTADKNYAVTDSSWGSWKKEYVDSEDGDNADCYIDIWKLITVQEYEDDKAFEVCPYCDREIEIEDELKISRCPHCGKWIVHCSMCRNHELNYSCNDCCLEVLAHSLNAEEAERELD